VGVPPAVELVWNRAQGAEVCIDGQELAAKVQATLGRPVTAPTGSGSGSSGSTGADLLWGQVSPLGGGWIAIVELRSASGSTLRREVALDAPDCRQLDEAIVLVVALMADAASPRVPRLSLPPPGPTVSIGIGPDLEVASGMLPGVAVGFGLESDIALPPLWHASIWAHGWPMSEVLAGSSGGRLAAWTFGLGPCISPFGHDRFGFFGCVGASGGVIYSSGVGLDLSLSRARPYWQGEARVGFRIRVAGPVYLRLELGLAVPAVRDSYAFHLANGAVNTVFQTGGVVPLGRLGVEFRAP
jgi:hypothetical protein